MPDQFSLGAFTGMSGLAQAATVTKRCVKCRSSKPLQDFYKNTHPGRGYFKSCKVCTLSYTKQYRIDNPIKVRVQHDKYYNRHRTRVYGRSLQKKYGITLAEYVTMLSAQDGQCALCGTSDPKPGGRKRRNGATRDVSWGFAVDHDHVTGKVRGLLCRSCNTALGLLKDNPDLFDKAAAYLRRYET